jgi:hypothetical protein
MMSKVGGIDGLQNIAFFNSLLKLGRQTPQRRSTRQPDRLATDR